MRRAARVDQNHAEIVEGLRSAGAAVTSLAPIGSGIPDLLVSYRGRWHLVEVKRPRGPRGGGGGELTADQREWIAHQRAPIHVVRSLSEALDAIRCACNGPRMR